MIRAVNVLITSAGVASAVNVIKSLRLQKEFSIAICAVDMDPLAPGLHLADHAYLSPPAADSGKYLDFLLAICKKHNINALYPCYSKELSIISRAKEAFAAIGVRTLLPSTEVIDLCNDKPKFIEFAMTLGLTVPRSYGKDKLQNISTHDFPRFCKPVTGSSSMGAVKINNQKDLDYYLYQQKDVLVQNFIEGQEVTVDVFCDRSSRPIVIAPRLRLSTKGGQSIKGRTIDNKDFTKPVTTLCCALPLIGVCNVQFIMAKDGPVLLELNPRYAAGGLMLTVHAGANIPFLALKEMLGHDINENECKTMKDIYMSRYWEEIFVKDGSMPSNL